ncbi:ATP-binding protein [Glacieibacterium megasporae]|uniref:ATP-binding protein n=1 Tax=Glacieibacterium megasporae TaxID=2835787 RepID=UPI001CAA5270|nr:ATP-binding protein [Polymorphobacter megasporae]UAJ12968.1 response regulator [Polymorphobacter megasporae]
MDPATDVGRSLLWTHSRLLMLTAKFDGTIIAANPAWTQMLGWSVDEIVGTSFFDLLHPDDLDRTVAEATAMMDERHQVPKFENRYRTKSGQYRDIDWTAVSDGRCIIAIGRDDTEGKRHTLALAEAEEAMRQGQKMEAIGQFTGGVAHDFNNLLTVITGAVDLLKRPDLSDERRAKFLNAIGDTAERATKLTRQLLAFARRQVLKPELFDVGASVVEVADVVRTLTGPRVEVDLNLPGGHLFTCADRSQFDTAVINLAINARDAMDGEGRLTIATGAVSSIPRLSLNKAVEGDFVAVTITDTGSGIGDDDLRKIFEPFFTTKEVGHGTGLGLSQVFGFAKQSGGDIHVSSELGRGSTFTLYLPRANSKNVAGSDKLASVVAAGTGVRVLVVEDNVSVGEFTSSALLELGYQCILSNSAQDALAELLKNAARFDVVFSDVNMPGMTGIELGEEVWRLYPGLPVVLTSGYSHDLAKNGLQGFELLQKPYSMEQLSGVLRKAVDRKTASR